MSRKKKRLYRYVVRAEELLLRRPSFSFGIYERLVWAHNKREAATMYPSSSGVRSVVVGVRQVGGKRCEQEEARRGE